MTLIVGPGGHRLWPANQCLGSPQCFNRCFFLGAERGIPEVNFSRQSAGADLWNGFWFPEKSGHGTLDDDRIAWTSSQSHKPIVNCTRYDLCKSFQDTCLGSLAPKHVEQTYFVNVYLENLGQKS